MKRYKNLYPHIYSFANLYLAYRRARKSKWGGTAISLRAALLAPVMALYGWARRDRNVLMGTGPAE